MTWKMFPTGKHLVILQARDRSKSQFAHQRGTRPERTVPDDRVGWIGVDIQNRSQIHVDADRPQLGGRR